ncbi:TRAP transporter large permease [Bacillus sp. Marseille-P3661]|uniref:TRAP transporter large permease n=1 Tax=Bacillus sp. Marseille-P3661 TaxID=1936234 RepID=UPI000C83B7D2|nr:TRAP transporter large permease [Bacillus sp. Marseille-P3661]
MEPFTVGIICMVAFFLMIIIGVPVGIGMALTGFAGFAYIVSTTASIGKIALIPFTTITDYNFAVIPAFILMAQIFGVSGFGAKLYDLCEKLLGYHRGGLALATVVASAVFAAISSSTIATVVTIGVIAIPEMMRRNYDPGLAGASVAAAGGLGILIPPSAILILYALMTEQSIRALFVAGIVPGMILAIAYVITIAIICRINPDLAPGTGERYSFKEKMKALAATWEVIAIIILSIGGLSWGWFTPTEAGAVGAAGAIIIAMARKKLTWEKLMTSLKGTAANSGMVGLIMIGAFTFNYFVAVTTIPQKIVSTISGIDASPILVMLVVTFMYLILGMFMDSLSMLLLTVPFMFPVVIALGFDPLWFGIYVVLVMEMAVITPPVGINVYATAGLFNWLTLEKVFRRVTPFVVAQIVVILVLLLFPDIVTFLPELLD